MYCNTIQGVAGSEVALAGAIGQESRSNVHARAGTEACLAHGVNVIVPDHLHAR